MVRRVDGYADSRYPSQALAAHCAFEAEGKPAWATILSYHTAMLHGAYEGALEEIVQEFRFFAGHITRFVDEEGKLLWQCAPVSLRRVPLMQLQPSQFFVDAQKLSAVQSFIHKGDDVILPVFSRGDRLVTMDGHTRLYAAWLLGAQTVQVYEHSVDKTLLLFVQEARDRGVFAVSDLTVLPHEEYEIAWNRYCDAFFAQKEGEVL